MKHFINEKDIMSNIDSLSSHTIALALTIVSNNEVDMVWIWSGYARPRKSTSFAFTASTLRSMHEAHCHNAFGINTMPIRDREARR